MQYYMVIGEDAMKLEIETQIENTDVEAIRSMMPQGGIIPHDYQCAAYRITGEAIKSYSGPIFINASVSAGKSLMIAMICYRFQQMGMAGMILSRQQEIISQDAEQLWEYGVKNSVFSAGLKTKSVAYPIICGTEKSVANGMTKELAGFVPSFIIIDENHQVSNTDLVKELPETQYSSVILEMQRRCKAFTGKELRIIGYTGSPFRGTDPILGVFWERQLCDISTSYLVKRGFIVPTIFGLPPSELRYDLHDFHSSEVDGVQDFSAKELERMQAEIMKQGSMTQKIMQEVVIATKNRNGVMITCSGVAHCKEAAKYLPDGSYAIVTASTGDKKRAEILAKAFTGEIKYLLQVGCLTCGVNLPLIDTSVLLRKIMSLTLLVQLLGRGMRKLKQSHINDGYAKEDHLVLDFTDTMAELGGLYNDPILEAAELAKAKKDESTIQCPVCSSENSPRARRCIGEDASTEDRRCEYFFSFKTCDDRVIDGVGEIKGCGAQNDPCARQCRKCGQQIYDPNAKLNERFYTDDDYVDVTGFKVEPTKSGDGLLYRYWYEKDGKTHQAREVFMINKKEPFIRNMWKMKGVIPHVQDPQTKGKLIHCTKPETVMGYSALISAPVKITHRVNDKGGDVINRKVFQWDLENQQ